MTQQENTTNDYAAALELNDRAGKIISLLGLDMRNGFDLTYYYQDGDNAKAINRCYVLLVNELEAIYARNEVLAKLNENPSTRACWTFFAAIESNEVAILDYDNEHRGFEEHLAHRAQVNRLVILAGKEAPEFTPELNKIIDDADRVIKAQVNHLHELESNRPVKYRGERFISEYTLAYKDDGSIVINGVLTLKKTQSGSAPRKLMEQAVKRPNDTFKPELGKITRSLSSTLSDMGITETLKQLFFPVVDKDGVIFRPLVNRNTVYEERIDTRELDKQLKKLGAATRHTLESDADEVEHRVMDEETIALLKEHGLSHLLEEDGEKERKDT